MNRSKRIQIKMIVGICAAIILFMAIIAKIISSIATKNIIKESQARYKLLAERTTQEITTWFSNEAQIVTNQKAAIEIRDDYSAESLSDYLSVIVSDYNEAGYIYDLYFVSTENVMASGIGYRPVPSIDFRTRPWYTGAVDCEELYYSNPYKDTNLDKYVITISAPVYDKKEKLKGVLALDIFVDTLFEISDKGEVPDNSYIFLLDGNMGVATHPNPAYGYVNEKPVSISELKNSSYGDLQHMIETSEYDILTVVDYDNVERDLFVSKVECCGWYVVVAVSTDVVHSFVIPMIAGIISAVFLCLFLGVICTLLGTKSLVGQLNEAVNAANAANEAKSSFLATMSHEIRTPIHAVIGLNEMILRENTDENIKDYATDIATASRSLISIVNDVLDFSKIEASNFEIMENEFNIASIINDTVNMSMARLGEKNLEIFVNVDPSLPVGIIGDEMRIQQIIVNLMTNGIKYTNQGFVSLKISYTRQEYGINLNVSVRDSGIGITEENLEKLFTSFQQIDEKRNRSVEGTGLGLAITKKLVTIMGGFINVTSKYGVGSEFKVSIPLKVSDRNPILAVDSADKIHAVYLFCKERYDGRTWNEYRHNLEEISEKLKFDLKRCRSIDEMKDLISDGQINITFVDRFSYFADEDYYISISDKVRVIVVQSRLEIKTLPDPIECIYKPFYTLSAAALLNKERDPSSPEIRKKEVTHFTAPEAKILIVDDNPVNLKVAAGLMKPYHMQIFTAKSGEEAIEMLEKNREFHLVFMDHMMPVMDGVETVRIIRGKKEQYFKKIPIIALTANTADNVREMFLQSGFDNFLSKPIHVSTLERILKNYLPESLQEQDTSGEIFNPKKGLVYTEGDEEVYNEILTVFEKTGKELSHRIKELYEAKDWKNYSIEVHALKSTSLHVGAALLSAVAKELEMAGREGNTAVIEEKNSKMLSLYDQVLGRIRSYLSERGIIKWEEEEDSDELPDDLLEIGEEQKVELMKRFQQACRNFDSDEAEQIAKEAAQFRVGEDALGNYFSRAVAFVRDYEYEAAAEEIANALTRQGGDGNENE